jgi:hypothetical protein
MQRERAQAIAKATEASQQKREWALLRPSHDEALALAVEIAERTGRPHFVVGYLGDSLVTNYPVQPPFVRVRPDGSMRRSNKRP